MRRLWHRTARVSILFVLALTAAILGPTPPAEAATFGVNDLGDASDISVGDGVCDSDPAPGDQCTLRAALEEANANGATADTITFSVAGTISPATALPDLASGNTTVAGSDQQVTIDGSGLPGGTPCLRVNSDSNAVKGLVIAGCAGSGIELNGGGNQVGGTTASERNVIRDGAQTGITGFGPAVTGNQILGNYVGLNETGDAAAPNSHGGILLGYGATNNTIGGSAPGARNVVSGNGNGVRLMGAGPNNLVEGNYIGLDATGSFPIPNGIGVQIDDGASGNSVLDNVISGNQWGPGVWVGGLFYNMSGSDTDIWTPIELIGRIDVSVPGQSWSQDAVGGQVPSWFFNANKGGQMELRLTQVGGECDHGPIWFRHLGTNETVQITGPYSGTCPGDGQVFFSWSQPINVPAADLSADNNVIQGNRIGTDAAGASAVPSQSGVYVMGSSSGTLIGGPNPGDGNLISGNQGVGVVIGGSSTNDVIQGNVIGLDQSGTNPLGNAGDGVQLGSYFDFTPASATIVEGNVISGNQGNGMLLWFSTTGASIRGNHIGTDASGALDLGNWGSGVSAWMVGTRNNVIGGPAPGEGNLIMFNQGSGVDIYDAASENEVRGNLISANDGLGVEVGELFYSLSGAGDDIWAPIALDDHMEITLNGWPMWSGTALDGSIPNVFFQANPNDELVIEVTSSDASASIGPVWLHHPVSGQVPEPVTAGADNGGAGTPIIIPHTIGIPLGYVSSFNVIQDNKIGTNAAGNAPMPNGWTGVLIRGSSSDTLIGGPGHGNVISGNNGEGITISGGSQNDVIQSNRIGVNAAGNAPLGNGHNGIHLGGPVGPSAVGTLIGGPGPGEGNIIGANGYNGVDLRDGAYGVVVQGNHLGTDASGTIDLGNGHTGVVAQFGAHDNLIGGVNPGEGNVIAFNIIAGLDVHDPGTVSNTIRGNSIYSNIGPGIGLSNGGNTELPPPNITSVGSVTGTACPNCAVDIYSDFEDEGRVYEGWTTADGLGNFAFPGTPVGPHVTATATDPDGNTSQFSDPAPSAGCAPGETCVRVTGGTGWPGGQVTVQLRVDNIPAGTLGAATVDVIYDPAVLSVAACDPDPGSLFDTALCSPNFGPNTIRLTGVSATGLSGHLALADLTFDIDPGAALGSTTMVAVAVVTLADTDGIDMPHGTENGTIRFGLVGDVNCNDNVDAVDALFILQYVVGLRTASDQCPPPPGTLYLLAANVNGDASVDAVDALFILQCILNLPPGNGLPFCTALAKGG